MFSRRQRTKQLTNFVFERIDKLIEILEIWFEVKILIRSIFEVKSSFFQSTINVQNVAFLSKNENIFDAVKNQKNFIEQIKQRLLIIKVEKKRVYLRHIFVRIKTKKRLIFLSLFSKWRSRFEKMSNFKQRRYHWKRIWNRKRQNYILTIFKNSLINT